MAHTVNHGMYKSNSKQIDTNTRKPRHARKPKRFTHARDTRGRAPVSGREFHHALFGAQRRVQRPRGQRGLQRARKLRSYEDREGFKGT